MAARKIAITGLPAKIRIFATMHQNPSILEIFECTTKEDLYDLAGKYPMETTVLANNANNSRTIEGYYMVGLALPGIVDPFPRPVIAYYHMNEHDWRVFGDAIKKEVERRKKQWNQTQTGWKNLTRPS